MNALQPEQAEFRPIDPRLLGNDFDFTFNLYYKTRVDGAERYLKFSGKTEQHRDKVRSLIDSGDLEEQLYVNERDVVGYYQRVTVVLQSFILDPKVGFEEKAGKVYDLSRNVMQEFFTYQASPHLLRMAEPVMEMMDQVLSEKSVGFAGLGKILNKDYYTYTHSVNVGLYCMTYASRSGMSAGEVKEMGMGGMLHDAGKVEIPAEIINKDGKLTDEEFAEIKKHPEAGKHMLEGMGCFGEQIIQMAYEHHEKFNGVGYPQGLKAEEISFPGRICKVMDVYDALTTRRSYKAPLTPFQALGIMKQGMAPEFDSAILDQFVQMLGDEG